MSLIVRVNEVLNSTVVVDMDVSTTCAVVTFRVKMSCSTPVADIMQERIKGTEKASPIHTLFHR